MPLVLSVVAAATLASTVTNTETVHDLESFSGQVIACTEGGLEVFTPAGKPIRVLTVEDGLPSHFCRALERAGDTLFAATDEGLVSLDARLKIRPVLGVKWHTLPSAEGASAAEYEARLGQLAQALPTGPTYTALSSRFVGTADGLVRERGTERVWPVPGPVRFLSETPRGLKVGTTEGAFFIDTAGKLSAAHRVPVGPLAYARTAGGGVSLLGSQGETQAWSGELPGDAPVPSALPHGITVMSTEGAWVGTRDSGVHLRVKGDWRRVTPTGQLCGNHVTALARHKGRLVVGTFDRGVCWQRDDGRWQSFRTPAIPSNQVLGVNSDGVRLYVATTYGLGLYDGKTWTQMAFGGRNPVALGKLSVLAAARLDTGVALVDGRGASIVAEGVPALSLVQRLPLPEGWSAHPSVADGAGRFLWVASEDRGLLRWDGSGWQRFHDGRDLTDNWVTALSTDAEGRAAVGTCQDGFNYFDGSRWTRVRDAQGLPSRAIVAMALVPGGALVGTLLGAAHYDAAGGTVRALPRLADPRVYAILVEGDTALFGTEAGLSRLHWTKKD
ncbi:MAG TPA: hypothetical protein VE153_18255 [Myxococcus sp.]|nr:hypothetical protein [Myxococcus sp.]